MFLPFAGFEIDDTNISILEDAMAFVEDDLRTLATVVVKGMIERIRQGVNPEYDDLDENSPRWIDYKVRRGYPDRPLQYTGGLTTEDTYQLRFISDREVIIELGGRYHQIHLNLIKISEQTGKNYSSWFGFNDNDIENVQITLQQIIEDKIRDLVYGNT